MTAHASAPLGYLLLSVSLCTACNGEVSASVDMSTGDDEAHAQGREPASGDATDDAGVVASGTKPTGDEDDASVSHPEGVAVFVASGHMGRTLVSCDDGKSWVHDHSADDRVRCFEDGLDCDHNEHAGTGLAYFDGWFIATFGWGEPGSIQRSQDGVTWETTLDQSTAGNNTTFAGLMAGGDRLIAGARNGKLSIDHGAHWVDAGDTNLGEVYNVRTGAYSGFGGGRYVIHAEDNQHATRVSSDGGKTWQAPSSIPGECGTNSLKLAGNATMLVLPSRDGIVCSSGDGGDTWQATDLAGTLESGAIWADGKFMAWGRKGGQGSVVFVSQNGKDWTSMQGPDFTVGAVAHNPHSGSFVAVSDAWNGWYEAQRFYHSDDGLRWQELASGKFKGGHPIRNIAFGTVEGGKSCP